MVSFGFVFAVFLSLLAIVSIGVIVIGVCPASKGCGGFHPHPDPGPNVERLIDPYVGVSSWGPAQPAPASNRSVCALYTFPAQDGNQPGAPVYNKSVLDTLTPTPAAGVDCVDPDQIIARLQQHTCQKIIPGHWDVVIMEAGSINRETARLFYEPCQITRCQTTLATIALNFSAEPSTNQCLRASNDMIHPTTCQLTDDHSYGD